MIRVAASVQGSFEPAVLRSQPAAGALNESLSWPAWSIALLGGLCVLLGLTYYMVRLRRAATRAARPRGDG